MVLELNMASIFKKKKVNKMTGESEKIFEALCELQGSREGDLSFAAGDELVFLDEKDGGWWKAKKVKTGEKGLVPSNFFQEKVPTPGIQTTQETPHQPTHFALYSYDASTNYEISFKKGDRMEILNKDSDWWMARIFTDGAAPKEGFVPSNYVTEVEGIRKEPWYKGKISRGDACKMLSSALNEDGSFLVRDSENTSGYALTVLKGGEPKHYRILQDCDQNYYVSTRQVFDTVKNLVEYYIGRDLNPGPLVLQCEDTQPQRPRRMSTIRSDVVREQSWEINRSAIELGKHLGKGQFGEVKQGRWNNQLDVAVKCIRNNAMEVEDFRREAEWLQKLRHPRLVKLYGVCTSPAEEPILIITELMAGGSLLDHLRKKEKKSLTANELVTLGSQVASGMAYLEAEGIVHRDLAARNVLVDEGARNAKVADLGLARLLKDEIYIMKTLICLPIKWMAPEVWDDHIFSTKTDVWSYGIFLYEVFDHGAMPYAGMSNQEVLPELKRGYRLPQPGSCPDQVYKLMKKCWDKEPTSRPSFDEIKVKMEEQLKTAKLWRK